MITCSCSPKIVKFTNESSRFHQFHTFTVVNFKGNAELSQEGADLMSTIRNLIESEMEQRDYTKDPIGPDLLVRYELISNQISEPASSGIVYRPLAYPGNYFQPRTILESALLIEITDRENKKLVWQASVDLNNYARKTDNKKILDTGVSQLFSTYLRKAGTNDPYIITKK